MINFFKKKRKSIPFKKVNLTKELASDLLYRVRVLEQDLKFQVDEAIQERLKEEGLDVIADTIRIQQGQLEQVLSRHAKPLKFKPLPKSFTNKKSKRKIK